MSQSANIYAYLSEGHTLTKAECYAKGWGLSVNSRCAEIRERLGADIECWTEQRNGKTVYVYGLKEKVAYG